MLQHHNVHQLKLLMFVRMCKGVASERLRLLQCSAVRLVLKMHHASSHALAEGEAAGRPA